MDDKNLTNREKLIEALIYYYENHLKANDIVEIPELLTIVTDYRMTDEDKQQS